MEHEATDATLIAAANAGDEGALRLLYARHQGFVASVAWRYLGNREDAQDVAQEVFVSFFKQFPGFALQGPLRGWLFPVTKNRAISLIRKRKPVIELSAVRDEGKLGWHAPSPEAGDLERMIAALPEGQAAVVRLRFGAGLKLEEIAEALEIPAGTVKSRLHSALKALRAEFSTQGEPSGALARPPSSHDRP